MSKIHISRPFEAYSGHEPYIFVSYAHADGADVYRELAALQAEGYRIWYDEGINPGNEWPEAIASALANAAQVITFISPSSVASRNVRNEINYALNNEKRVVAVHLLETNLGPGLGLQIGAIQAILAYQMSREQYRDKLKKSLDASTRAIPPALASLQFESGLQVPERIVESGLSERVQVATPLIPGHFASWGRGWALATALLIGACAAILSEFLVITTPRIGHTELFVHQAWLVRHPAQVSPDIQLITIEQGTPNALGLADPDAPLPRSIHAKLVRALRDAGAKVVLIDLQFGGDANRPGSAELWNAMSEHGNTQIVIPAIETQPPVRGSDAPGGWNFFFAAPRFMSENIPANLHIGHARPFGPGGVLDGAVMLAPIPGSEYFIAHVAFCAVLARYGIEQDNVKWDTDRDVINAGAFQWPVGADGELHALWTAPGAGFPHTELAHALQFLTTEEGRSRFRDRYVLIGDVRPAANEIVATPTGPMAGVDFVAQLVNTLDQAAHIVRWTILANTLWAFLLAAFVSSSFSGLRIPRIIVGVIVGVCAACLVPAFGVAVGGIWIDTVGPCLAVLFAAGSIAIIEGVRARIIAGRYLRASGRKVA